MRAQIHARVATPRLRETARARRRFYIRTVSIRQEPGVTSTQRRGHATGRLGGRFPASARSLAELAAHLGQERAGTSRQLTRDAEIGETILQARESSPPKAQSKSTHTTSTLPPCRRGGSQRTGCAWRAVYRAFAKSQCDSGCVRSGRTERTK